MKPSISTRYRIKAARLRAMKAGLIACLAAILHSGASAQCANNLGTRTYDTTVSGSSYNSLNMNFPMWNPDSGLLVSVKLSSEVSSQYSFTLGNTDIHQTTFMLQIGQQEQFSSPQLTSTFTGSYPPQMIGSYPLSPGQTISQPAFTFLNKYVTSDSITGVAPFMGSGQVSVSYTSFTYTMLSSFPSSYYSYGANINNTMHFSLQYLYCKGAGVTLATNLTRWTAALEKPRTVRLGWSAVNEARGRVYHIQRSTDGRSFGEIGFVPARNDNNPDYGYSDILPDGAAGKFYYRLLIDDQGAISYSSVQQVSVKADPRGVTVYPNPATDFITINPGSAGSWQVDILSADGRLVQRETFLQTNSMRVNFRTRMSAGIYFVRAYDLRGQKNFAASFVVPGH
ncbi:MAG: T9SS type A sorting domain-containing protein [Bacteroidetes bacterium]|nr:T9SS type A sorting domain-containing protein [Bacteroidota bacterium]